MTRESGTKSSLNQRFGNAAQWVSQQSGRTPAFLAAVAVVVIWAISGPMFDFSETWQLIINTGTTIVTFLMVFLIQNTQNRDTQAIQLKLDELIRVNADARNGMLTLEDLSDEELLKVKAGFAQLADEQQDALEELHEAKQEVEEATDELRAVKNKDG